MICHYLSPDGGRRTWGGGGKKSRGFQGERSGDQSSLTGYRKKGRLYKIVYQGEVSLKYYRVYGGDQLNLAVTQHTYIHTYIHSLFDK